MTTPRPVTAADVQRYAEMILSELPDSSGLPTFASAARRATERIIADVLSPAPDPLSAYQAASNELHYAEEDQRAVAEAVAAERERIRQRGVAAAMGALAVHRWKTMGADSAECECGELVYGNADPFPADEAFRRHLAEAVVADLLAGDQP